MKERPILFSGPMVRAILAGQKTQTRRVMIPQPQHLQVHVHHGKTVYEGDHRMWCWGKCFVDNIWDFGANYADNRVMAKHCPYGVPGDKLWVREEHYRYGHWEEVLGAKTKKGRSKWRFVADTTQLLYSEDRDFLISTFGEKGVRGGRHHKDPHTSAWHKRLPRFMPKSASRITLEITDVRVQRLRDISEKDAIAEGIVACRIPADDEGPERVGYMVGPDDGKSGLTVKPEESFRGLWESINGQDAWQANPWVWAIAFKRI